MKSFLRFTLLLAGLYLLYIGIGLILTATGIKKTWWVLPNKVLTTGEYNRDKSVAGTDGPYIFYNNNTIVVKQLISRDDTVLVQIDTFSTTYKDSLFVPCRFKNKPGWNFKAKLKDSLVNEKSVYHKPDSMLIISDIEGEFSAFRKLLIANNVINKLYQWTFKTGHLVLIGDFFDRGLHVTECLWLIYHLESEAEQAGGKVHFVLGNHEIMNMSGDYRYVRNKYFENAQLLEVDYKDLYTPGTELGRWLQTKNVAEKIGNMLVVHAGFSKEVNELGLDLKQLNETCRQAYFTPDSVRRKTDKGTLKTLYSSKTSPFWFRKLAFEKASESMLDRTLALYDVEHVLIGHTVVVEITGFYKKKVIDVDVKHSTNMPQALLYTNNKFYVADTNGKIRLLK